MQRSGASTAVAMEKPSTGHSLLRLPFRVFNVWSYAGELAPRKLLTRAVQKSPGYQKVVDFYKGNSLASPLASLAPFPVTHIEVGCELVFYVINLFSETSLLVSFAIFGCVPH